MSIERFWLLVSFDPDAILFFLKKYLNTQATWSINSPGGDKGRAIVIVRTVAIAVAGAVVRTVVRTIVRTVVRTVATELR